MLLGQGFGVSTFTTLDLLVRRKNIPKWWWKNGDESHGIESVKKHHQTKIQATWMISDFFCFDQCRLTFKGGEPGQSD